MLARRKSESCVRGVVVDPTATCANDRASEAANGPAYPRLDTDAPTIASDASQHSTGRHLREYVAHAESATAERVHAEKSEPSGERVNEAVDQGRGSPQPRTATGATETGAVIRYEEFTPFGTTAYRLFDNSIDVPAKRYRYTGLERDDETGLGYHGARYYASWLGRWTAADPIGLGDGVNLFEYSRGNPIRLSDPSGMFGTEPDIDQYLTSSEDDAVYSTEPEVEPIMTENAPVYEFEGDDVVGTANAEARARTRLEEQNESAKRIQANAAAYEKKQAQQQSTEYVTAEGTFTQAELDAQRVRRELAVAAGPTIAAISYAGGEGVSLETAELLGTAEAAIGSMAKPVQNVTRRSTARDTGPAPSEKARVLDQRTPSRPLPTEAAKDGGPFIGGGGTLEKLTPGEIARIQNAANRSGQEIGVVGSRVNPKKPLRPNSDYDFVIDANSKIRNNLSRSLPGARNVREGTPGNQDIFKGKADPKRPHVIFRPEK